MKSFFRLIFKASKKFIADECSYKASALTYYTLLSIVPILAIAFAIAKNIGLEKILEREVSNRLLDQPELAQQVIDFAYKMLDQTHGGLLAAFAILSLLWTSLQLLMNAEYSLNAIFAFKSHRSYLRQIRDFLAILIVFPFFFILTGSLSVVVFGFIKGSSTHPILKIFHPYLTYSAQFLPFLINWFLFTFIYLFIPESRISWKHAVFAGIFAGSLYQIVQWIYIYFQIGIASYGAVYGSFAALPLFLVWVNMSWNIVLLGAEIAALLKGNHPK